MAVGRDGLQLEGGDGHGFDSRRLEMLPALELGQDLGQLEPGDASPDDGLKCRTSWLNRAGNPDCLFTTNRSQV